MGVKAYTLKMTYIWLPVLLVFAFGLYFLARLCAIRLDMPYNLLVYFFYGFSAYHLWSMFKIYLPHALAIVYYDKTIVRKELNRDILFNEIVGNSIPYTDGNDCKELSKYAIYLTEEELNQIIKEDK